MTELTIYKPKHEIELFDWTKYYIDSSMSETFFQSWENAKTVRIWDSMLATSAIRIVRPAEWWISKLESILQGHSEIVKKKVRETVFIWKKDNPQKDLTEGIIQNMIKKYS